MKNSPFTNAFRKDANGIPIPIGASFQTEDGAASPLTSPLTLTGSPQKITIPTNAMEFIVAPSADMLISEKQSMASYDTVVGGSKEAIECTGMSEIWINGSGTLSFRLNLA